MYLYRYTSNEKYREWAWDYVKSLEDYSKKQYGYASYANVWLNDGKVKVRCVNICACMHQMRMCRYI